ncbi:MAG: hypothetical protein V1793_22930 [Pseudomonadota bacterium]
MLAKKIRTEGEQIDFFEKCRLAFNNAATAAGTVSRYYRIAQTLVRIDFAGQAMVPGIIGKHFKGDGP